MFNHVGTGKTAIRDSFNGIVHYQQFKDADGVLRWEGYGKSSEPGIPDFYEVVDWIHGLWRTDLEGVTLPDAGGQEIVEDFGNFDGIQGGWYSDYDRTDYYTEHGEQRRFLTRDVRYAVSVHHVESRGCCCNLDDCVCDDAVFEDYNITRALIRVNGGWIIGVEYPYLLDTPDAVPPKQNRLKNVVK
jgi:hypothetical protein